MNNQLFPIPGIKIVKHQGVVYQKLTTQQLLDLPIATPASIQSVKREVKSNKEFFVAIINDQFFVTDELNTDNECFILSDNETPAIDSVHLNIKSVYDYLKDKKCVWTGAPAKTWIDIGVNIHGDLYCLVFMTNYHMRVKPLFGNYKPISRSLEVPEEVIDYYEIYKKEGIKAAIDRYRRRTECTLREAYSFIEELINSKKSGV